MSAADLHDLELVWPSLGPTDVIVTGTFDQWSSSIHLVKGDAGFSGVVKVPWDQKIAYKFVVDGHWRCRDDRPQEEDGHGNINNVLRTPGKPLPPAHIPPARLSIPLADPQSDGHGDLENMVTAVEFLPPHEPATIIRGSLPIPIPQITVEGLSQAPPAGPSVSESKLNTAAATEGHVSPASPETPAKPTSCDVSTLPINDNGPVTLPSINGNGEAHESHRTSAHAPAQLTNGELPTSLPVSETAKVASAESAVAQQGTQDTPALTDHVDAPPTAPASAAKQPPANATETAAQGHRQQATLPASIGQGSVPSTPPSSTLTHKKRRSLFARIKHIFDRDSDRQGKKEKNKH